MKKILVVMMILVMMISCVGCSTGSKDNAEERTVVDMRGVSVKVPAEINSYAVYWVGGTDIVAMLDGMKGICAYPETSAGFPYLEKIYPNIKDCKVLSKDDVSAEEIISTGAQVLFVRYSDNEELFKQLEDAGIAVIDIEFNDYDALAKAVDVVADVFGTDEAKKKAEAYRNYLQVAIKESEAVVANISDDDKPTIITIRDAETLKAYGPGRFSGSWVNYVGAKSCLEMDDPNGYVSLSDEQLMEYDPDYIVFALENQAAAFTSNSKYKELSSCKNGNVFNSPSVVNTWSNQGAESVLQLKWGLRYISNVQNLDMENIVKEFYLQFYEYELSDEEIKNILDTK